MGLRLAKPYMILDIILFKDPSVKRHVAKTITWRIVGTIDTMLIGWLITGDVMTGLKIGGIEVVTKMILYYFQYYLSASFVTDLHFLHK